MKIYDIAVVGAGPAGLTAAMYAARFCRSTVVLHDSSSRASRIPKTYNTPGFEDGVSGHDLIERMSQHASRFGANFEDTSITDARRDQNGFTLSNKDGVKWQARAVILATGLNLNQIDLPHDVHEAAIAAGILRYCPICDGYEHRGERIGIVGCDISGASEALFLRQFSHDVTLLPKNDAELTETERRDLAAAGVKTVVQPITRYDPREREFAIFVAGNVKPLVFDVVYPALGVRPKNLLASQLGLQLSDDGKALAQSLLGANVAGVYCAGDLVEGLDQIAVAMGHGAVAATRAHNWLRDRDGDTADAVL